VAKAKQACDSGNESLEPRQLRATAGQWRGEAYRTGPAPRSRLGTGTLRKPGPRCSLGTQRYRPCAPSPYSSGASASASASVSCWRGRAWAPLPLTGPPLEALGSAGGQRSAVSRLRGGWVRPGSSLVPLRRAVAGEIHGRRDWHAARGPGGRCTRPRPLPRPAPVLRCTLCPIALSRCY
jgi:hypothetical protein